MLRALLHAAAPSCGACCAARRLRLGHASQGALQRPPRRLAASAAEAQVAPPLADDEWEGLRSWRTAGVNENCRWGDDSPAPGAAPGAERYAGVALPPTLAECGRLVLMTVEPEGKAALTHAAFRAWCAGELPVGSAAAPDEPARPALPELVPLKQVPTLAESPLPLSAHVLHTLAHIEKNAVDLAWDTVVRFSSGPAARSLPAGFYSDFARVADDEARHLGWCLARLRELGHTYGELPSHNQLWMGAAASAGDVLERMAVVPCVQEARGLDAGPRLAAKLIGAGDTRSAAVVRRIAAEEWAHVAVGVAWLRAVCAARSRDPGDAFRDAVARHVPDGLKGPFDRHARVKVGLPREWWDASYDAAAAAQEAAAQQPRRRRGRARNGGVAGAPADAFAGVRSRLEQIVAAEASAAGADSVRDTL